MNKTHGFIFAIVGILIFPLKQTMLGFQLNLLIYIVLAVLPFLLTLHAVLCTKTNAKVGLAILLCMEAIIGFFPTLTFVKALDQGKIILMSKLFDGLAWYYVIFGMVWVILSSLQHERKS